METVSVWDYIASAYFYLFLAFYVALGLAGLVFLAYTIIKIIKVLVQIERWFLGVETEKKNWRVGS